DILSLQSVWLPDAFNPISVQGVRDVSYDPSTNSLLTAASTSDGLQYTVTSYDYLSTLSKADLESAPPLVVTGDLNRDVQLPAINPQVLSLAQQLTAGKVTE